MQREGNSRGGRGGDGLMKQWTRIAAVVCTYWFVSISMVFLNKYLLSSKTLKLDAPLFITMSQCMVAVIVFVCLAVASKHYDFISFPDINFTTSTALQVLPLSVIFVSMITFNNLTLKYLGVAFYNVGRSLTTVFNVAFTYVVLGQTISLNVGICCGVIVSGFTLGIKEEHSSSDSSDDDSSGFSFLGIACGVLASLSVALYAIFTKRILPVVDSNIWRLQFYNNLNALLLLIPLMLIMGEASILKSFKFWTSLAFWGLLIMAGVFGIAIGYVTALQIQVTSPLTHNISGTAKAGAQTVLACVIFSQSKSGWWWLSNAMVLAGSSAYTYVRMTEMKKNGGSGSGTSSTAKGGGGGGGEERKTLLVMEQDSEEPSTSKP